MAALNIPLPRHLANLEFRETLMHLSIRRARRTADKKTKSERAR